jgi:hypothetical protein
MCSGRKTALSENDLIAPIARVTNAISAATKETAKSGSQQRSIVELFIVPLPGRCLVNNHRCLSLSLLLSALAVFAQDQRPFRGGVRIAAPRFPMQVVVGAPYSGDRVTETDQSLADGTHIRHSTTTKLYRDSAGRVRAEAPLRSSDPESQSTLLMVHISDPVAHVLYVLDPVNKVAHRQELPVSETLLRPRPIETAEPAAPRTTHSTGKVEIIDEDLGTRSMEGLIVEGNRHTTIRAVGEMGNDHPMTEVDERWSSPELRLLVFQRRTGPQIGEQIDKLINIVRNEPEAALFQIPSDYTVMEEHGDFSLSWSGR